MSANYAPTYIHYGDLQVDAAGSNSKSVARRGDVAALSFITGIDSGSSSLLSVTNGLLKAESLLITDVTVDNTHATLAAWISAGIPAGMKTGDVLVLSAASPSETYMCKVPSPAAAGDFVRLNDATTYTGGNGIILSGNSFAVDLDPTNPIFEFVNGKLKGKIDAGGGIHATAGGLEIKLDGTTLSKSANGVKVNQISNSEIAANAAIAQSKLDISIGNADVAANAAIAQSKLALSIGNADVAANAAIAQSKLALSIGNADVAANAAIAQSKLDLSIADADVAANAAIASSKIAGLRFEASNQSLSANQAFTVTHNLGKKVVHVSVMRTSDSKLVDVEVTYTNTTTLSLMSSQGLTADIVVSI